MTVEPHPDLRTFADWVERDRREPDKLLCHVASMRRAADDADARRIIAGAQRP